MELLERIRSAFPEGQPPDSGTLVVFDGFDELDKESAVRVFAGKTRADVRELVGRGPTGWQGLWGIDELGFLEIAALQYYVEPFLTYMVREELAEPQDVSFWLGYHLSEVVRLRGTAVFSPPQRHVLVELAGLVVARVDGKEEWAVAHRRSWGELAERLGRASRG